MITLPIQSSYSNTDWVETLRVHNDIEIPAVATLEITDVNQELCEQAKELQKLDDSTNIIIYLFQSAIAPFEASITINSAEQLALEISPEKRSYMIKTKSPLTISISKIILSIKAGATARQMVSGELPGTIELKPRELLLLTDISEEIFKDHSKRQISNLNAALNEKAPKTHYYEIISDDKLQFVSLGSGWPSGITLRSDSKFTLRLLRK